MARAGRGWYSRGYLPHFDGGSILQSVTFHFADAFPQELLLRWRDELAHLPKADSYREERRRLMAYLDRGEGAAYMARPEIADLVENALLHGDGKQHELHSWVVMPNHVHALFRPLPGFPLSDILKSWKSYTGRKINEKVGSSGRLWFPESYDRFIRDAEHYDNVVNYIEMNPVKVGLSNTPAEYRWGSAWGQRGRRPG